MPSDPYVSCSHLQEPSVDTNESGIFDSNVTEEKEEISKERFNKEREEFVQQSSHCTEISARPDEEISKNERQDSKYDLRTLLLDVINEVRTMKDGINELTKANTAMQTECKAVARGLRLLESKAVETAAEQQKSFEDSLQKQRQECKDYTDSELRTLESKVNGLAAVLEHVQNRCLEREMSDVDNTEHESVSSSDPEAAEDEVVSGEDEGFSLELIQEKRNRCWLRQNHVKLMNAINPQQDFLLHHLAQENILTQSDEEKILSHSTRKEQSRELLLRLRRCTSGQFKTFLGHLGSEHSLDECARSVDDDMGEADLIPCVTCDIIIIAQVDDVIDHVYQHDYIDVITFEDVMKMSSARDKWCCLLGKLACKSGGREILVNALQKKYPQISKRLAFSRQTSFECCCSQAK